MILWVMFTCTFKSCLNFECTNVVFISFANNVNWRHLSQQIVSVLMQNSPMFSILIVQKWEEWWEIRCRLLKMASVPNFEYEIRYNAFEHLWIVKVECFKPSDLLKEMLYFDVWRYDYENAKYWKGKWKMKTELNEREPNFEEKKRERETNTA